MALINNIYVLVEDEEISRDTKIAQHPVEKGLPLTDSIRNEPKAISISGKIVDTSAYTSDAIISKLEDLRTSGSLITYKGRNAAGNFQIKSFNTSHPNTVWGGAEFDMELVEVRVAKSAYTPPKVQPAKKQTIKVGSIVVFKGGPVYVSSDATKAAATRGRSTCKVTIINTRSWSKHDYHLISTDGGKVYGWVDAANIEGTGVTVVEKPKKAGTKKVEEKPPKMYLNGTVKYTQTITLTKKDTINGKVGHIVVGGVYYVKYKEKTEGRGKVAWNEVYFPSSSLIPLTKLSKDGKRDYQITAGRKNYFLGVGK